LALVLSSCSSVETIDVDVSLPVLSVEALPPDPGVVVFGTNGILDDLEALLGVEIPRDDIGAAEQALGLAVRSQYSVVDGGAPGETPPATEPQAGSSSLTIELASASTELLARETNYSREGEAFMAGTLVSGMLVPSLFQSEGVSRLPVGGSSNSEDRWGNSSAESAGGITVTRTSADTVSVVVSQVVTATANGIATTVTNSVSIEGKVCPLDDGEFDFTATLKNTAAASADQEGTGTVQQDLQVRVTGRLGTDGTPESLNLDGTQTTTHTAASGRTVSVETRHRKQNTSVTEVFDFATATAEVVRSSPDSTPAERQRLASLGAGRLALFGSGSVIGTALNMWGGGGCVTLRAPAPTLVDAGASTSVTVTATSTVTGEELSLPVTMTLDGQRSIDPSTLTSTGSFTHIAGDAGTRSSVLLKTESRRGRDTESIAIGTARRSYFAEGGGGEIVVSGEICDLVRPFVLTGGGVTLSFFPENEAGGTRVYEDDGSFGGGLVVLTGEGPYSVSFDEAGVATGIVGAGTGTSSSIAGEFTFPLNDVFTLTPLDTPPANCR
jgi:hypothetical protein